MDSAEQLGIPLDTIIHGDCTTVLSTLPPSSVDLVFTSPPYGNNRKSTYKGPSFANYVKWFLPISEQLYKVLRPEGSFVLNIKERAANGERQTYVLELTLALKKQGWYWIEEYIWHKKNSYPGKWPNRFRDSWERCLHFTKQKRFKMLQEAVMVSVGDWAQPRLKNLSDQDKLRHESAAKSGLGRKVSNWVGREKVYPTNVLHLPTECSNRDHSATFPKELPLWFIRLFTEEESVVLDPFIGSGTTALACVDSNRHFIGIDLSTEYVNIARQATLDSKRRQKQVAPAVNGDIQAPLPKFTTVEVNTNGRVTRTPVRESSPRSS